MGAMIALFSRPAFCVVLFVVAMAVPARAEQLSLQALVTPPRLALLGLSRWVVKDANTLPHLRIRIARIAVLFSKLILLGHRRLPYPGRGGVPRKFEDSFINQKQCSLDDSRWE